MKSILALIFLAPGLALAAPVYSMHDDGGEHPIIRCQKDKQLPKDKLEELPDWKGKEHYLGSVQVEFADKNEAGIDAWRHYFSRRATCDREAKQLDAKREQG